jgi:hypothetical protein
MNIKSKASQFIDQLANALNEQMEELDSLRTENKRLKANIKDLLSPSPAPPADDEPWDRKPGRKYIANDTWQNFPGTRVYRGDVVEVIPISPGKIENVRNLRTGDLLWMGLDQDSWRLPTPEENIKIYPSEGAPGGNVPEAAGTLVTDFDSLKVGDILSLRRRADVKVKLLKLCERADGERWYTVEIIEGDSPGTTIDPLDVTAGFVRLLSRASRKPYVKDGRWMAEVGDRFRNLDDIYVIKVEQAANTSGYYLCRRQKDGKEITTQLNEAFWEPVS